MSDTTASHHDRVTQLASQALETTIAHQLVEWTALTVLVAKVAGPRGHIDQAIELLVDRRPEAELIATRELEDLTEAEREHFKRAAARHTALAMTVAADMLARAGRCLNATDVYDMPPHVIAAVGATLATSGLLKDAIAILDDPNP
jgi:predicted metal-dependent phosphoesterase TrpH